ncbi:MAG: 23S rRNA (pseudouridine(1915)-N(3))-methyltransferase RlmH [Ruminococcaceae bacterium]|nr:23S rRNA (pseudouridine(1915)-N(3))-methyltransferase RlmH [Oscillospiraceae bacterium]
MLNVTYIYFGQQKDEYFRKAMDEYIKRIGKYAKFSEKVLKPENLPDNPTQSEINTALEKEAKNLLPLLSKSAYKIAMCVEGKTMSSEAFAGTFQKAMNDGRSEIVFIVGSSHGLSDTVKKACDLRLSFSPMTFAHGLFGVMLTEQIYRAFTILKGEKYHK